MDVIEGNINIPPDVLADSMAASVDLLPEKTRERYQKEYEDFKEWLKIKRINLVNEDVLLAYVKGKSEMYSPNSLWTKVSMLKLTLKVYDNIDISRFGKLFAFLKRKSEGYRPKKSNILSEEQVMTFLLEADDGVWLLEKVILICGIFGACRGDELLKLNVEDFEDTNKNVIVTLRITKNKKSRVFLIPKEGLPFNAYQLYQKYAEKRPQNLETRRFFIVYRKEKCVRQVVGIHTIGGVPRKIAKFLKLKNPELYTGHSFRRSSATMLAENGGDLLAVKELGGWDSSAVAESYIENSVSKRLKITKQLFQRSNGNSEITTSIATASSSSVTSTGDSGPQVSYDGLQISSNNNCHFNFHIHYNK
ncbi:uncharacterized protein LOC116180103 [Photinus pyralis]|uniref:uncharacterized protein LOC116177264 n=2 Tax=Photinus pyralis TaxID=7054 RepID=UPI0012676E49|nr:uncharacterized protein LOC116177264 [Photinus pyralis]XP_031355798.1 uncharacterized protein LOC116180103 [Photinus pyralis]